MTRDKSCPANSFLPLTKHLITANGNLFVLTLKIIDVQENGNKEASAINHRLYSTNKMLIAFCFLLCIL